MMDIRDLLGKTNRTDHDVERAVKNGSFYVKGSEWNKFVVDENWMCDDEYYPTIEKLMADKSKADELDLELVTYDGDVYVLVIVR